MSDQTPAQKDASQPGVSSPPLNTVQTVSTPAAAASTAQELAKVEKELSGFERSTLKWARTAVLMSGAAAIFVCLQWWEMHTGSIDTHNLAVAARKQAEIASFALCETQRNNILQQRLSDANRVVAENSAENSLSATIRNSNLDQRAWVGVETVGGIPELNKQFIVSIRLRNTGKTFAKHVVMAAMEEGRITGKPLGFSSEVAKDVNSISLIPPNGEYTIKVIGSGEGSDPHLDNPDQAGLSKIKADLFHIFVHGRVDYEDVFKQKHWTTYCFRLVGGEGWATCDEHNDADNKGTDRSPIKPQALQPVAEPPPCPKPT